MRRRSEVIQKPIYENNGYSLRAPSGLGSAADVTAAIAAASAAQAAADAAQTSANLANEIHDIIASDGKLTPVEKKRERLQWDAIFLERPGIQTQASTFNVSNTDYDTAFLNLATYLNAGTPWISGVPSWLADANLGITTNIGGPTYRGNWSDFYDKRQTLLNAIADKARIYANAAQTTADAAAAAAAAAQSDANTANALHADIASDSKLTPVEKHKERAEWDKILGERSGIQAQADTFGVSRSAYDADFQALANYLNDGVGWISGVPSWLADANLGTTTTIVGATYRANWAALYDERQALLNAIADKARLNAAGAQTTADTANAAAAYADALARSSYNLIKNGNSEDPNPTGYEAAGIVGYAYEGSKSRFVQTRLVAFTPKIPCSAGDQFYMESVVQSYNDGTSAGQIAIRFYDANGNYLNGNGPAIAYRPNWTKITASATAPANAVSVDFSAYVPTGGCYFDCLYATRKISAGVIEADAVQTIHLDAYAVTASKIATDAVKTSDYAEDAYGNPTAGALMGVNTTQPIKCGPNGLQIGKGVFNQQSLIFERIVNGIFWTSAQGWSLAGAQPPTWSSANPRITGTGNVVTTNSTTIPPEGSRSVTATGSASQLLNLPSLDPNQSAYNLTLWLGSDYTLTGAGALFRGITAYAKVYLTNLGAGGSETLIGTLNISTPDAYTQGTFDLSAVYTAPGVYGLRIEISASANAEAGISASATLTARARLADVKFTA